MRKHIIKAIAIAIFTIAATGCYSTIQQEDRFIHDLTDYLQKTESNPVTIGQ